MRFPSSSIMAGVLTVLLLLFKVVDAFGVPGMAATAHSPGDLVRLEVNDIRSSRNPVSYDFYNKKLPFAGSKPDGKKHGSKFSSDYSLAALLSGERRQFSPYVFPALEDGCYSFGVSKMDKKMTRRVAKLIQRQYRVQLVADGLPIVNNGVSLFKGSCNAKFSRRWSKTANYQRGYYLGVPTACTGRAMLNNHVHLELIYYIVEEHEKQFYEQVELGDGLKARRRVSGRRGVSKGNAVPSDKLILIVGATAEPYSIDWEKEGKNNWGVGMQCPSVTSLMHPETPNNPVNKAKDEPAPAANGDDDLDADDGQDGFDVDPDDDGDDGDDKDLFGGDLDGNVDGGDGAGGIAGGDGADGESLAFKIDRYKKENVLTLNKDGMVVTWTYTVKWTNDQSIKWATRWDAYFKHHPLSVKHSTYLFSIVISAAVIASLMSFITAVLVRALRRDIMKSAPMFLSPEDELIAQEEEMGWKAIRGDVFRPPPNPALLSVAVGAGVQLLLTGVFTVLCGVCGFASPASRGSLASLIMAFFLLSSFLGATSCAWVSLELGQEKKWSTAAGLVVGFSGTLVGLFTLVNIILRFAGSSGALPFWPMVFLYFIWLALYCPLGFVGAAAGFSTLHRPAHKVSAVQRLIAYEKVTSLFRAPTVLAYSGIPAFVVVLLLLTVLFQGMWEGIMFYVFGLFACTGALWLVACMLTSIVAVYYNLCGENYLWHWLSFLAPSSGGIPVACFALWFFFTKMQATTVTGIIVYFAYMTLFTYLYVLLSGSVGFLCTLAFIRFIYSTTKAE